MSSAAREQPLRIAILVKQVPDPNQITVDKATRRPVIAGTPVVNTFDSYAIAEALDLKDRYGADVTIVTVGPASARDAILRGLGTGADRGRHLLVEDGDRYDSLSLATLIADALRDESYDLVIAGQTSEDMETAQVGPQVAELLGMPHVSQVSGVEIDDDRLRISRDSEGRKQVIGVALPCMLLVLTGRDGVQRHPTLKGMMQAKRKPIDVTTIAPHTGNSPMSWSELVAPVRTGEAIIVQDVEPAQAAKQLVGWLRDKHII